MDLWGTLPFSRKNNHHFLGFSKGSLIPQNRLRTTALKWCIWSEGWLMGESCPVDRCSVRTQLTSVQHPQNCSIKLKPFPAVPWTSSSYWGEGEEGRASLFSALEVTFLCSVSCLHLQRGQLFLWAPRLPKETSVPLGLLLDGCIASCMPNALCFHIGTISEVTPSERLVPGTRWIIWMMPTAKMEKLSPCRVEQSGRWSSSSSGLHCRADPEAGPPQQHGRVMPSSQACRVRLLSWENQSISRMILFELCSAHCLCTHLQGQSDPAPSSN